MPYPVIPEYITVHLGAPGSYAENYTLPFSEYIKNVASSEIYPDWPENAIRANILAQVSFALNRVYTEYYRSRGFDYDITSDTRYDQAFRKNREIYENISRITDSIFNNYVVRRGNIEPLFAQFCDGIRSTCDGLSQWGTVGLAEQGYSPYEILRYYYGNDIDIVYNAPVGGNIPTYPGTVISRGAFGEDVRTIKNQLNRIRKNYPAIPEISTETEAYDSETENAVKSFQRIFGLNPTGNVDKATWYKIKQIYSGIKGLSELVGEGLTFSEAERKFPRILRYGDEGLYVRVLQYYLAFIGYFLPDLPPIAVNGFFGDETRDALYAFQAKYGISVTGEANAETWNKLTEVYAEVLTDLPEDYKNYAAQIYPGKFITRGDSGEYVVTLQNNINSVAAQIPEVPRVPVTGVYDDESVAAVRILQGIYGYEQNGVVGPLLWSRLASEGGGF